VVQTAYIVCVKRCSSKNIDKFHPLRNTSTGPAVFLIQISRRNRVIEVPLIVVTPELWRRRYRSIWESHGDSRGNSVWPEITGESFISSFRHQPGTVCQKFNINGSLVCLLAMKKRSPCASTLL